MHEHVNLLVELVEGRPVFEPVHARRLPNGHCVLLHSPGLVQGIAAGDEFVLTDHPGGFEVIARAGNVAVQLYAADGVAVFAAELDAAVQTIGGKLDGQVTKGMVFTIPIAVGFETIERLFNAFVADLPGVAWVYGNVYADAQGRVLLDWVASR